MVRHPIAPGEAILTYHYIHHAIWSPNPLLDPRPCASYILFSSWLRLEVAFSNSNLVIIDDSLSFIKSTFYHIPPSKLPLWIPVMPSDPLDPRPILPYPCVLFSIRWIPFSTLYLASKIFHLPSFLHLLPLNPSSLDSSSTLCPSYLFPFTHLSPFLYFCDMINSNFSSSPSWPFLHCITPFSFV